MTSYTWTGNGGGDSWNNDDNWSTPEDDPALSIPGGGDLVYFSSPATITDSGSADDVTLTSTLELDGGTITVTTNTASTFYVDYGGMLSVVSSGSIDAQAMYAEGSADFDDGTLTISNFLAVEGGEVTIENGASLTASTTNPNDSGVLVGYAAEGVLRPRSAGCGL